MFSDPVVTTVILAVASLCVSVAALVLQWLQIKRRRLVYEIVELDQGTNDSLSTILLRFTNCGNQALLPEHFHQPVKVSFIPDSDLLGAHVRISHERDVPMEVRLLGHTLVLQPALLNPRDTVTVALECSRLPRELVVKGRVAGVTHIEEVSRRRRQIRVLRAFGTCLGIVTLLAGVYVSVKRTSIPGLPVWSWAAIAVVFIVLMLLILWTTVSATVALRRSASLPRH